MHEVECISVDRTGISVCLFKAAVRSYIFSLYVVRRICVVTGCLCQYKIKGIELYL